MTAMSWIIPFSSTIIHKDILRIAVDINVKLTVRKVVIQCQPKRIGCRRDKRGGRLPLADIAGGIFELVVLHHAVIILMKHTVRELEFAAAETGDRGGHIGTVPVPLVSGVHIMGSAVRTFKGNGVIGSQFIKRLVKDNIGGNGNIVAFRFSLRNKRTPLSVTHIDGRRPQQIVCAIQFRQNSLV